ncbi:MAG: alpha/beta hydrolase [Candidatus Saccharimonadales bacterium]
MHKHKRELVVSSLILGVMVILIVSYLLVPALKQVANDAYHSVFKIIISDRILDKQGEIYSDIAYCGTTDSQQTLDLFMPDTGDQSQVPLVIFIHGGGWHTGDKANREVAFYGESLLKQGIAVASVNYRLTPEFTSPVQQDDIACAVRYLRDNAARYQLSDRWGMFGDSAGAQLGAVTVSDGSLRGVFRAFVGFYGPYDLSQQINRRPRPDADALRYTNNGRDVSVASPINLPAAHSVRYLLVHGDRDTIVPPQQSQQFFDKLRREGVSSELLMVRGASHSFTPRSQPSSTVIRNRVTQFYSDVLK